MSSFSKKVIEIVKKIPKGKVMNYGQVALFAGLPRGARAVGWILKQTAEGEVPWWRIVNQSGRISIRGNWQADKNLQKRLLEADGVEVEDYQVDMGKYRYLPVSKIEEV